MSLAVNNAMRTLTAVLLGFDKWRQEGKSLNDERPEHDSHT